MPHGRSGILVLGTPDDPRLAKREEGTIIVAQNGVLSGFNINNNGVSSPPAFAKEIICSRNLSPARAKEIDFIGEGDPCRDS